MRQKALRVTSIVLLIAVLFTFIQSDTVQASQRRRQKVRVPKATSSAKNSPPAIKDDAAIYDLGVDVKKTPFGKVVILTNREKAPIAIRKLTINDEWEVEKGNDNLLHSTKSWVSLPVELMLGDSVRVPISSYSREVIYIKLDTDKGTLRFKVNR